MDINIQRTFKKMVVTDLSPAVVIGPASTTHKFVKSHWPVVASFAHLKFEAYGMKGAVVLDAHQPDREVEDILVIDGEAIGIDYEIPSGFADLAARTGVDVRDILDAISEYDPEHEAVVVLIRRDGRAEFGAYAFTPAPLDAVAPMPIPAN